MQRTFRIALVSTICCLLASALTALAASTSGSSPSYAGTAVVDNTQFYAAATLAAASTAPGNYQFAFVDYAGTGNYSGAPSGWSQVCVAKGAASIAVFVHLNGSSEPASNAWGVGGTNGVYGIAIGAVANAGGVDGSICNAPSNGANTITSSAPSIGSSGTSDLTATWATVSGSAGSLLFSGPGNQAVWAPGANAAEGYYYTGVPVAVTYTNGSGSPHFSPLAAQIAFQPLGATPTPSASPSQTPLPASTSSVAASPAASASPTATPGTCSPVITSPGGGATVSGTITVTVTPNCPAFSFLRLYTSTVTEQFAIGATSVSFNTTGLPNGSYSMAVIAWDPTGLILEGVSPALSYTIANGASASPTVTSAPTASPSPTSSAVPTSSPTPVPSGTPTPGAIVPIGNPPLPPGTSHWVLTLNDNFNTDGSINTSVWNGGGGVPSGTEGVFCPDAFGGLGYGAECPDEYYGSLGTAPYETLNPGVGAQIQAEITSGASNYYWSTLQTDGSVVQRYGYWEIMAQQPHDNSGEGDGTHPDIWLTVPCRTDFGGGTNCVDEVDIAENYLSTESCALDQTHSGIYDGGIGAGSGNEPSNNVGDLSAKFHAYGAQWAPPGANNSTGSQGSWQFFFDGAAQSGPFGINDSNWSEGVYLLLYDDFFTAGSSTFWCGAAATGNTSNNDPLVVQYVRIWQAE